LLVQVWLLSSIAFVVAFLTWSSVNSLCSDKAVVLAGLIKPLYLSASAWRADFSISAIWFGDL
jgi:hypothetical protein